MEVEARNDCTTDDGVICRISQSYFKQNRRRGRQDDRRSIEDEHDASHTRVRHTMMLDM